jgi:AraC-like DNA-binding protein
MSIGVKYMSKEDELNVVSDAAFIEEQLRALLEAVPYQYHLKIHRMHHLTVPHKWRIEDHRRNEDLHFLYVEAGGGEYVIDGRPVALHRGRIIFVSNQCAHSGRPDPANLPTIIPIRFGVYHNATLQMVNWFTKPCYFALQPETTITFERKLDQLYDFYRSHDPLGREQRCSAMMYEVILELYRMMTRGRTRLQDDQLAYIKRAIDERLDHTMSLERWARKAGMSEKQLSRKFRSTYGMTLKQYQIQAIIRHAHFLLEHTTSSVTAIARQLGYPDPYTFSKQYKQVMGHSPAQVRR